MQNNDTSTDAKESISQFFIPQNISYNPTEETCTKIQDRIPDIVDRTGVQAAFCLLYVTVWLLGVVGNLLVIYVGTRQKLNFRVKTDCILNLAVSDLLNGVFSLPFTAVTIFARVWVLPTFLCYSIGTVQGSSIFISSFTLTLIAMDRYFMIVHPTVSNPITRPKILMLGFWIFGYLITSPMLAFSKSIHYRGICGTFCEERWPGKSRQIYSMTIVTMQFGLPLLIALFCYGSISRKVGDQIRIRLQMETGCGAKSIHDRDAKLHKRRKHTNRMMLLMVAFFVLSYFPLNFINLVKDFGLYHLIPSERISIMFAVCHLISMTSIMWNPLVYGWFNQPFRQAVMDLFFPKRRQLSGAGARQTPNNNQDNISTNISHQRLVTTTSTFTNTNTTAAAAGGKYSVVQNPNNKTSAAAAGGKYSAAGHQQNQSSKFAGGVPVSAAILVSNKNTTENNTTATVSLIHHNDSPAGQSESLTRGRRP